MTGDDDKDNFLGLLVLWIETWKTIWHTNIKNALITSSAKKQFFTPVLANASLSLSQTQDSLFFTGVTRKLRFNKPIWWPKGIRYENPSDAPRHSEEELNIILSRFAGTEPLPGIAEDFEMEEEDIAEDDVGQDVVMCHLLTYHVVTSAYFSFE